MKTTTTTMNITQRKQHTHTRLTRRDGMNNNTQETRRKREEKEEDEGSSIYIIYI
jgi:hypothetical protein